MTISMLLYEIWAAYLVVLVIDSMFTGWQQARYKKRVPRKLWKEADYPRMTLVYRGKNNFFTTLFLLVIFPYVCSFFFILICYALISAIFSAVQSFCTTFKEEVMEPFQ